MAKGYVKGKKNWIQKAVKHPGLFTKEAKAHKEGVHEYAEKEKHKGGKVGDRARLALRFESMRHKKK